MKKTILVIVLVGNIFIAGSKASAKEFKGLQNIRQGVLNLLNIKRPVLQPPSAKAQAHYVRVYDPYHNTTCSMGIVNDPALSEVLRKQALQESYTHAFNQGRLFPSPDGNYHVPIHH